MELDVHLTREGEEPWGFEFIGGADYGIPLTIDQVSPSSPAYVAGLQPGDIVARLGDKLATELSQEAAIEIVAEAVGSLSFGICRGLYDPVVNDYEPIYETIERADSDLRSEPTEVQFSIQQFEPNDPSLDNPNVTDLSMYDSGYDTRPMTENRSLTASPFVPNAKPYRPFSTEPLEVPPLDDPLILNPNYKDMFNFKDEFGNLRHVDPEEEYLLSLIPLEKNVEPKFKLPVSEKYDPEYDKKVKALLEKCAEGGKQETRHVEHELVYYAGKASDAVSTVKTSTGIKEAVKVCKVNVEEEVNVESVKKMTIEKVKFDVNIEEQIDKKTLQQTALQVVEESIERAVSVTEEIQKEVEEEMRASMTKELQETEISSEVKARTEETELNGDRKESMTKNEIAESRSDETEMLEKNKSKSQTEVMVTENEEKISEQFVKDLQFVEERKLSTKQEMEEVLETEFVKKKSSAFEKDDGVSSSENDKENLESLRDRKFSTQQGHEETKSFGTLNKQSMAFEKEENINLETKHSEGKQKAFMIGLQTIPHIKGFVQSSYHFDLLLRTFFVHLTDVMVALSRFILTQPAVELEGKAESVIKEKLIKEFASQNTQKYEKRETQRRHEERKQSMVKKDVVLETDISQSQNKMAKHEMKIAEVSKDLKQELKEFKKETYEEKQSIEKPEDTSKKQESIEIYTEDVERRKKSGAEMAQMAQRKSKDLTQKMDAVITEFETKAGIEDRLEITEQSRRRSRSRSQIEEEVMKESDPLEWLDKVDSRRASQERTDISTVKKGFSSFSESKESKKSETMHESRSTKAKPGKKMYIAIVESHVYTNKDAILEDQVAELSETASVQSSEEINTALESLEAISTETMAISSTQNQEKQQAVEVIANALQEVVQEKQEVLEAVSDFQVKMTKQHLKSVTQESHASIAAESTEIISESTVKTLEEKELREAKTVAVQEESYKTAAVKFVDVPLEATKEVVIESKSSKQEAVAKQELLATVAAEFTEIISDDSKLESFETKEMEAKTAVISTEENYKATAVNATEIILEATKDEKADLLKINQQQALAKVESLTIAVAETTHVVADDSKLESFDTAKVISEKANVESEETFKTAAIKSTEIAFEVTQDEHLEVAKSDHATIKQEAQHLAVAGIIETKTEVCKEPKKPAEDEYASLKIVKEQAINGDESVEILSESELNVKKSLLMETSSSQQIESSISKSEERHQMVSQEPTSLVLESFNSLAESSKLHIRTDLAQEVLERSTSGQTDENNNTPSPSTVPPTPLTDEYVFKLEIPLPKNQGTVVVEESPEREDPNIVKKGLVPHIDITIEEQIIYDPPLPTPPEDKVQSPVYTKPGLRGGYEPLFRKEYIREIERKSSLLASAIDQTIKSIEEYKEEVGIDTKKEDQITKTGKMASKCDKIDENTAIANGFSHTNGVTNGHDTENKDSESKMKEEWSEIEIQMTENNENVKELSKEMTKDKGKEGNDVLPGFKPVVFNPEAFQAKLYEEVIRGTCDLEPKEVKIYVDESGEPLGTIKGIVDGLEDAVVDEEVAKELGKPGLTEETIAVLISGESEMLREAHVMGLSRVITSHMTRADDSSVDFQKIKPLVESLKDSEVLKALNEEILKNKEEKKKEKKNWTTFLQKPKRPVPRAKFGYFGYVEPEEDEVEEPYKVKIVKQPKPKVAPDYKPEDFDTGPLPWEQRALIEPVPSPVPPEDPILVPEEVPEFLEALDTLPESEVPDLEDTGIPLPPPAPPLEYPLPPPEDPVPSEVPPESPPELPPPEAEEPPTMHVVDQNQMSEQLVNTVKSMVDPNASLEQQLAQMRAQLSALAQLPCVIQQSLEMLTKQLSTINHQNNHQMNYEALMNTESRQEYQENSMETIQEYQIEESQSNGVAQNNHDTVTIEEVQLQQKPVLTQEEYAILKREEDAMAEQQRRNEKEQEKTRLEHESRQVKQRSTPRVGKPKRMFGPPNPEDRPLVLPGGRRWRGPKDAITEQMIDETLQAQSEILQGKVMGYESDLLPYDSRINFMKYEKPPVKLDHLKESATYKMIHNLEEAPVKRVELRTPVLAEADYRERCRSATPGMQTNGQM